ncbi:Unknown protein [Striga hermonthica]|uniref:DUF1985 domain-containing protein n=1 Tax=Striga hermonthica TaxID=68872 RepID=A0A9N7MLV7_STRHE|nr:Unknown protein [Striga hermonthica]
MKKQVPSSDSDDFQSDHGRKNPKNMRRYHKSKIPNSTEREWELLIPHPRDINVKVQNSNDNSKEKCTISDIKKTLTKEQLEAFRMTDEIWFDFGGKFLRFGIEEFAVVSGLKCTGLSKKLNIPKIANGLHDKYFAGLELTWSHIRWQFMKKLWASDEDAVKFAKLHFLANFVMGSQDALRIDRCFVDMIDSP